MKILYIAKHNSGGNDEEGSIAWALEQLGHKVLRIPESLPPGRINPFDASIVLFHKWSRLVDLRLVPIPKVFWYFDLVEYPDPLLSSRNHTRRVWMNYNLQYVDLGFCTDGDWVAKDSTNKLVWLPQGFDGRRFGSPPRYDGKVDVLFTGISTGGGKARIDFVNEMKSRYGDRFLHVSRGTHGEALATLINSAKVVVAPSHPCTDRYWSNRVYLTTGYGGFLLHPFSHGLTSQYVRGSELVMYESQDELHGLIDRYVGDEQARREVATAGRTRTLLQHTYLHRCRTMMDVIKERLV